MFQCSDEVYKHLFYDSSRAISFALTCFYLANYLEHFFYYYGVATAEVNGFWTPEANVKCVQRHTYSHILFTKILNFS